jgi:hypothetical protein
MGKKFLFASTALGALMALSLPAQADYWWTTTKISGRMYWDITNISHDRNDVEQSDQGTSFDIKRFYVGIDHDFDDMFSANVTTDFQYVSAESLTQVYIKKAYLQAKFSKAFIIQVGSSDVPWVPFVEGVYGYRHIENTLIDRTKYGTSADWGLHVKGELADGLIGYQVSAINGAGYKNPRRTDNIDLEGRVNLNYKGFIAAIGGYTGKLGIAHGAADFNTASRFDALVAYTDKEIRVGVEYFHANDFFSVTANRTDEADGYSVFASYQFDPQWSVFGKYEWVQPESSSAALLGTSGPNEHMRDGYFNIGVQYSPAKIVDIALVYKHDHGDGGFLSTSNGTIGGLGGGTDGDYDEIGIWGQLRW